MLDVVVADIFAVADWQGHSCSFHNTVDMCSGCILVTPVESKQPTVCLQALHSSWCGWAGPPGRVVMDQGGEFMHEYGQGLEELGTRVVPCASISTTQNSMAERHGGAWQRHDRALTDEYSLDVRDRS